MSRRLRLPEFWGAPGRPIAACHRFLTKRGAAFRFLRRRLLDRHKRSSFGVNALWPDPID